MPSFKGFKKYRSKPQKPGYAFHNFLNSNFNGPFEHKKGLALGFLILLIGGAILYYIPSPFFHSEQPNSPLLCNGVYNAGQFCSQVTNDPTTPIQKYSAPNANLGEFNIAGTVSYTTVCDGLTAGTNACLKMSATAPPPPLPIQFNQKTPINTLFAKITPQTLTSVYRRISWTANDTFEFDVSGGHAQTVTWQIVTVSSTTVTFYGLQPSTVTCQCTASYNGVETLVYGPGVTDTFTLVFNGANLACLCAMAESVTPIGDLSPGAAKELEFQFDWGLISNTTVTPNCNYNCSWAFFLTTNSTLWETNNQNFNPYNDPSIALLVNIQPPSLGSNVYGQNVWIQQQPGETIQQEDTGGCSGSALLCSTQALNTVGGNGAVSYTILNYTAASPSSNPQNVGSNNCPNPFNAGGGPGCNYAMSYEYGAANFGGYASNGKLPTLPLAQTYYAGFWLGSGQLGSPVVFCFDKGNGQTGIHNCNFQLTSVLNGCIAASMEIDFCIPDPTKTYSPPPTTDSGGWIGQGLRFVGHLLSPLASAASSFFHGATGFLGQQLSGILNIIVSTATPGYAALVNLASGLAAALMGALASVITAGLNAVGGLIGWPTLGTDVINSLSSITKFLVQTLKLILTGSDSALNDLITLALVVLQFFFFGNSAFLDYWIGQLAGFIGVILSIAGIILQVLKVMQVAAPLLVLFDFLWLMMESYDTGVEGAMRWWRPHEILAVDIGKMLWYLVQGTASLIYYIVSSMEQGFEDVKPSAAGFEA